MVSPLKFRGQKKNYNKKVGEIVFAASCEISAVAHSRDVRMPFHAYSALFWN
jgi:hypothetical protein